MNECQLGGLVAIIEDMYPVSFIIIVLSVATTVTIAWIKRPYIKFLAETD